MWTGIELLHVLQDVRNAVPDLVSVFLEGICNPLVYIAIPFVIGAFVYWFVGKKEGELILLNMVMAIMVAWIVKWFVKQPRPWVLDPGIQPRPESLKYAGGSSLPSGHTSAVWASFGTICQVLRNRYIRIGCLFMMVMVPFSRMFLGVHTPLDIIAAMAVAFAVCLVNHRALAWCEGNHLRHRVVLMAWMAVAAVFTTAIMLNGGTLNQITYVGFFIGLPTGLLLEDAFVHHEVDQLDKKTLAIRAAVCSLLCIVTFALPYVLLGNQWGYIVGGFVAMVMITAVCPAVMKKMKGYGL